MRLEGDGLSIECPLHSTPLLSQTPQREGGKRPSGMARGRTTRRRRRRSLPHGQKSGARIVDLFGGVVDVDRHSVDMGRTKASAAGGSPSCLCPAGFILTELEVHALSDKNSPDCMQQACNVTVEITESDKLLLPLPQSLSDAVCPLSAGDDASLPRQRRHPNGIKIGAPFCGDDGGGRSVQSITANARSCGCLVGWLGVARSVGDVIN